MGTVCWYKVQQKMTVSVRWKGGRCFPRTNPKSCTTEAWRGLNHGIGVGGNGWSFEGGFGSPCRTWQLSVEERGQASETSNWTAVGSGSV